MTDHIIKFKELSDSELIIKQLNCFTFTLKNFLTISLMFVMIHFMFKYFPLWIPITLSIFIIMTVVARMMNDVSLSSSLRKEIKRRNL